MTQNSGTIIVGVDFSEYSSEAVHQAMNVARKTGRDLCLVHVGVVPSPPPDVPDAMVSTRDTYQALLKERLVEDRGRLEDLRSSLTGQGVEISHMVIDGFPDSGLVDAAKSLGASLIVTGSHGRTGLTRFLLGSVAERVARLSHRDVLVARKGKEDGQGGYRRILCATDFSQNADRALERAIGMVAKGGRIDLLHCWQLPPLSYSYFAPTRSAADLATPLRDSISADVTARGEALVAKHAADDFELTWNAVESSPTHGIQEWIERDGYGLVVTGSHGWRGIRRFVLGSVAEVTIRHAKCSVLVIHAAPE